MIRKAGWGGGVGCGVWGVCCPFQARYEKTWGGGAVHFRPNTKSGVCLEEEGEVPYMKGGGCNPQPPPPPPHVSTSVQGIHENDLEWYVTLVVYTHASLKSSIMETVACEQQSDDQSVDTTDGIAYTMPVLYGHNGAVDNTQIPKIYAFNTLEILYTQLSV